MSKCKKENCTEKQLLTNIKESSFCKSHTCSFRYCVKETFSDKFTTCESHTCSKCQISYEYLEDNGLELCTKCFDTQIRQQQIKFATGCLILICIYYLFTNFFSQ